MQIKNDRLLVSKVSCKFRIPTIYNFAVIYPWNLFLSFLFIDRTLRLNNLKTRTAMNMKISLFVICAIIYFLLFNLHNCAFNDVHYQLRRLKPCKFQQLKLAKGVSRNKTWSYSCVFLQTLNIYLFHRKWLNLTL